MGKTPVYIIMGVSGCGKSTIGKLLANALEIPFFDGDDFHSNKNIAKMANGIPLDDSDRKGWLQSLNELSKKHESNGTVIACSALKEIYREQLRKGMENKMVFVYLSGTFEEILGRLKTRKNHYMPTALLKSQFDTLELPKNALRVSVKLSPEEIVSEILKSTT